MKVDRRDKAETKEKRKRLGKSAERAVCVLPTIHPSFPLSGLEWERLGGDDAEGPILAGADDPTMAILNSSKDTITTKEASFRSEEKPGRSTGSRLTTLAVRRRLTKQPNRLMHEELLTPSW